MIQERIEALAADTATLEVEHTETDPKKSGKTHHLKLTVTGFQVDCFSSIIGY